MRKILFVIVTMSLAFFSCRNQQKESEKDMENPFFKTWTTPYGVPPFDEIKEAHYVPAVKEGIDKHEAEIDAIVSESEEPTFENTILAFDKSGELLDKVTSVFYPLSSANTNDNMQAIAREISPLLTQHSDNISLNPVLFQRIKAVYEKRNEAGLDDPQKRVTEKYYQDFVRNGADLSDEDQETLRGINEELSKLSLEFGEHLLAETNKNFELVIDKEEDLAGLPDDVIARAAQAAKDRGHEGKWVITLAKPSMIPFLQFSEKRDLREKLYRGYFMRCNNGDEYDNKDIIKKMVQLRDQRAKLLGYENHANYIIDVNMAKTPEAVYDFLMQLWNPAMDMAKKDVEEMQAIIDREGGDFELASWDWWHYIEKLRKEKFDFDESALKPYLSLDNAKKGIFYVVEQLYGLQFVKRDWPVYHPEVEVYEVLEADDSHLGVLYMDFHPRDGKRVGAWSTSFRDATYRDGERISTIGTIVMNFTRPTGDNPALLSFSDEVLTFFHEFGHALHGLFSDGPYDRTAGVVSRDFVELPSQIMEHWAAEPEVLKVYARHYETGEPMPDELIEKLERSGTFNQGFMTGEYVAAALLDMDWHTPEDPDIEDVLAFEEASMDRIGLIPEILPRYRSTYFAHIFSGGYSAGYYVYYWAAVLDTDAFNAFKETGDIFNQEYAARFRELLETCGSDEGMDVYVKFRGKKPSIDPYLKSKGLK